MDIAKVGAILNVGSFHEYKNPHVVTLFRDEPFWGLKETYRRFWNSLEPAARTLIYGEFQGVRGIYLSGTVKTKEYNTRPVKEWKKNPTGFPCHISLNLSRINLNDVKPLSLDELSEMDVPFFKQKPERLLSIIFFDESTIGKFDELWRIFNERNRIEEKVIPEVIKDELDEWVPKRFLELKRGALPSNEFQRRVNEIFRALGFKVIEFPAGTYPDAVVYLPDPYKSINPFWIVIDSKNIPSHNLPEADKRAMTEYVESQKLDVLNRGLDPSKCYFLFIAPSFEKRAEEKIRSIQNETKANGGLLAVETLLHLTLIRLKYGVDARVDKFPALIKGAEITRESVNNLLAS